MLHYLALTVCLLPVFHCAPIKKRMVDMTYVIDNTTIYYPIHKKFELTVTINGTYNDSFWLQIDEFTSGTHFGTHMDAPSHFVKGGLNIDQVPVSRLIAPAAVVDVSRKADADADYEATIDDLMEWESQTKQTLNEVILLLRSGWGKRWHSRDLFTGTTELDMSKLHFPGIHPDAAQWLVDNRNIYGIGTETLSMDNGVSSEFFSHRILLKENIFILENVAKMDELPLYGAMLYVMPMKIGKASGAPVRMVATFPEVIFGS